ncbi:MAG: hypothetical protein PHY66_12775 [Aliarcobacter sp.]|nr:hypothetical protein [Aliarcobacter sp.]
MKEQIKKVLNQLYLEARDTHDLESKIELYAFCAASYCHNYSNSFVHLDLEKDLVSISEKIIDIDLFNEYDDSHILHVMTEAFSHGGHTRVVDNWIKLAPFKHSVIFNNPNSFQPSFLVESVKSKGGKIILNDKNSFIEKANFLAQIASRFKYIVLHHHNLDILPLLAFGTKKFSRPIFLYNHADHLWGCGYSVSDYIIELSQQGMIHSEKYRGIPLDRMILGGIPIELSDKLFLNNYEKNQKYIISMASSYKFYPIDNLSFQDFLDRLLSTEPNVEYYVIGVSSSDDNWQELKLKYPTRVHLKGILEKKDAHELIKKATLYLDSFPLGSGTSLLEAVSLGIPVISYSSPAQNMDAYKEFSYSNLNELYCESIRILNLSVIERNKIVIKAWESIYKWHSLETFKKNIGTLDNITVHSPIKLNENIIEDRYKENYTNFMYAISKQNNFIFESTIVDTMSIDLKQELTNIFCSLDILKYTKRLGSNQTWMGYLLFKNTLFIQLFLDNGKGISEETSLKLPVAYSNKTQEFIFDLSGQTSLHSIRMDILNDICIVEIEKIVLITQTGEIELEEFISSNAYLKSGNTYWFDHDDSQLYFNAFESDNYINADKLIVAVRYSHIGNDVLSKCYKSIKEESLSVKKELVYVNEKLSCVKEELVCEKEELIRVKNTLSWKVTKPLRKIKRILEDKLD